MTVRNRARRVFGGVVGTRTLGSNVTHYRSYGFSQTCQDVNDDPFKFDHPLFVSKQANLSCSPITGDFGLYGKAENLPPSCARSVGLSHLPLFGPYNVVAKIASMSPGEPQVQIPVALYELKELPDMLKTLVLAGKKFKPDPNATPHSDAWLAYTFGWRPLINDIMALYKVTDWVDSRARMLANANKRGYISRQQALGSDTASKSTNNAPYDSTLVSWVGESVLTTTAEYWVSSRWRPIGYTMYGSLTSLDRHRLYAAALGLDLSFSTLYDAMPWSWLIDWCTDISSILRVRSNRAGFRFSSACLMDHRETTQVVTPYPKPKILAGSVVNKYSTKSRTLVSASLSDIGLNWLGAGQLSTLAAILSSSKGRVLSKTL